MSVVKLEICFCGVVSLEICFYGGSDFETLKCERLHVTLIHFFVGFQTQADSVFAKSQSFVTFTASDD